jgi:predicted nucleic acid-binding protein
MSASKSSRTFLDTNILVYAEDHTDPVKQRRALGLIKEHLTQRTGVVSLQILQEYFVTVTKKLKLEDAGIARNKVVIFSKFDIAKPVSHLQNCLLAIICIRARLQSCHKCLT